MADPGISLDKAELLAIFLETFLYGIFFTLFWITFWILCKKRSEAKRDRLLVAVLVFMLVLSTSHIIIDFVRIIEAFVVHLDPILGGPIGYYGQISQPLYIAKNVVFTLISLTGDAVMAWRCYVVYRKSLFAIIVPSTLIIASFVSACFVVKGVSSAPAGATIFVTATPWLTTLFVLGLSTNTYCTALIVYRIWSSMHSLGPRHKGSGGLMPVIMALVESGGLHASAWLGLLVTYLAGSNGQYAALDTITPLVGIVYSLIIIQIDAYTSRTPSVTTNADLSWRSMQRPAHTNRNSYPLQPHTVDITVTTHRAVHADSNQTNIRFPSLSIDESKEVKHLDDAGDGLTQYT